jgi:oligoendopeptidase F
MSCNTADKKIAKDFNYFVQEIEPTLTKLTNQLDHKLLDAAPFKDIESKKYYVYTRALKKKTEIFRDKNLPLISELQVEQQEYSQVTGAMSIHYADQELTMQEAANYLKDPDRKVRKEVFELITQRRAAEYTKLHDLYSRLIKKRTQVAQNADFESYVPYQFASLGRFDYTIEDCRNFHASVQQAVVPLVKNIHLQRKEKLGYETLYPYDLEVDVEQKPPLKPFTDSDELIAKTIQCLHLVKPEFGRYIRTMKEEGYLDLETRKNKAPGGYNYPLYESNIPFIFMNSANSFRDLTTMVHEAGHAIHSFLTRDLELVYFKDTSAEIAELASMAMELISMEHWQIFFPDKDELLRARRYQLESIISTLPWVATIDKFQHWIYSNPEHSFEEREAAWDRISAQFSSDVVDWRNYSRQRANNWQRQIHLFQYPFYYIEYGMAQLGAIAVWKNYKEHPDTGIEAYKNALKLGYSVPIPEVYKAAGIAFNFSREYIQSLMDFVQNELGFVINNK